MSDLYDSDVLLWSEEQARALRAAAAAGANLPIDWENVAEEIEDVGRSQMHAVKSLLMQALRHTLKADGWPQSRDAPSWRADAIDFRQQAADRFTPSMRQRIDIGELYANALRAMPESIDGQPPAAVPSACPFTLDELLRLD